AHCAQRKRREGTPTAVALGGATDAGPLSPGGALPRGDDVNWQRPGARSVTRWYATYDCWTSAGDRDQDACGTPAHCRLGQDRCHTALRGGQTGAGSGTRGAVACAGAST